MPRNLPELGVGKNPGIVTAFIVMRLLSKEILLLFSPSENLSY